MELQQIIDGSTRTAIVWIGPYLFGGDGDPQWRVVDPDHRHADRHGQGASTANSAIPAIIRQGVRLSTNDSQARLVPL